MDRNIPPQDSITPQTPAPLRLSIGYISALVVIFLTTSGAWLVLSRVTTNRTSRFDYQLRKQVGQLWGGQHRQQAPRVDANPRSGASKHCQKTVALTPKATKANVHLSLDPRRKGLLWYNTYRVDFRSRYRFENPDGCPRDGNLVVPLPAANAIYDGFALTVNGRQRELSFAGRNVRHATAEILIPAGAKIEVELRYSSRGFDHWTYAFARGTARVPNFELTVTTDFDAVDFPSSALSPSQKRRKGNGWQLDWRFSNLLTDARIAVAMPKKLNPGPLASDISRFAPVSLLFFFSILLLVAIIRQVRLHPVHFAMLAAAFFAFHLLFVYLVDHVSLVSAFGIAAVCSVGLVISYLRLVVGARFALLWAGGAQMLYLVLFSLAFFFEGFTGLTITVFSVLTLFAVMQLTAKIDWFSRFASAPRPPTRLSAEQLSSSHVPPAAPTVAPFTELR
jgi:hypothetical protein